MNLKAQDLRIEYNNHKMTAVQEATSTFFNMNSFTILRKRNFIHKARKEGIKYFHPRYCRNTPFFCLN